MFVLSLCCIVLASVSYLVFLKSIFHCKKMILNNQDSVGVTCFTVNAPWLTSVRLLSRRSNRPLHLQSQRSNNPLCPSCPTKRPKRPQTSPPPPPWPCCASSRRPSTGRAPPSSIRRHPGHRPPGGTCSLTSARRRPGCRLRPCTRLWTGSTSTVAPRTMSTATTLMASTGPSLTGTETTGCCRRCSR